MRKFLRECSLTLFFGLLFLSSLVGQAFAGWKTFNNEQLVDGLGRLTLPQYLTSASFTGDVAENWQSEYLQFLLYITITVWLVQKGSPESKALDKAGLESDEEQMVGRHAHADSPRWAKAGGLRTVVYSWSLGLVMGVVFLLSWLAQSVSGSAAFNESRLRQLQDPISWASYVRNPGFWSRTLQNWQSEFLAVASMVALSIYLRQRGSPESKPVGEPHDTTGAGG